MTTRIGPVAAGMPLASPDERRRVTIPPLDSIPKPIFEDLHIIDMVPFHRSADENALHRFGHVEPGARTRRVQEPNAAFMTPMTPSPALAEIVGSKAIPRTEVTKRLWAYIKKNKLQDPKNRRMIKADGVLKDVFGGKSTVSMFEMTKLVSKHLK